MTYHTQDGGALEMLYFAGKDLSSKDNQDGRMDGWTDDGTSVRSSPRNVISSIPTFLLFGIEGCNML